MSNPNIHRKPKDEVERVFLYNTRDSSGEWVPQVFNKGAWVFMQPAPTGSHCVRDRGNLDQHWKGRLLGFKDHRVNGMVAIFKHVYSMPNMCLRQTNPTTFPSNCKFSLFNVIKDICIGLRVC